MTPSICFWFRRDLRLNDNYGLSQALSQGISVFPIFIFDTDILNSLDKDDARVSFIHDALQTLDTELKQRGSGLNVFHGKPMDVFRGLLKSKQITDVYVNEDYEPYAIARDRSVQDLLHAHNHKFLSFKDQVIFAKNEVVKKDGTAYRMFTPYARTWKASLTSLSCKASVTKGKFAPHNRSTLPDLKDIGFQRTSMYLPSAQLTRKTLSEYAKTRDILSLAGTSKIGVHLRFGTVSIRHAVQLALKHSDVWLNELIWREFFMQILHHYPHTVTEPFDERFQRVAWLNDKAQFESWCHGQTGYPIVDAGMRELNATGFMHNRARMITASFLTKHLLIDWRWGERYFAKKLLDFDLAANVGNWQWVAGSGCDAAPYFRIFNPTLQAQKFDPHAEYIQRWVPEIKAGKYIDPIVDHETARRRAMVALTRAVKGKAS